MLNGQLCHIISPKNGITMLLASPKILLLHNQENYVIIKCRFHSIFISVIIKCRLHSIFIRTDLLVI